METMRQYGYNNSSYNYSPGPTRRECILTGLAMLAVVIGVSKWNDKTIEDAQSNNNSNDRDLEGERDWRVPEFEDSGEIMVLGEDENWWNKMYVPVSRKYKGVTPYDVDYASRRLSKEYQDQGKETCHLYKDGLGGDMAGSSKHVPEFKAELVDK